MPSGAITLADIASADWSLMLDATAAQLNLAAGGIGNVVQGIDDVNQCLAIILTTPPGSDPLRPTFGCDLWRFIDYPVSAAIPAMVAAITAAVTQWEPRVKLLSVTANLVANDPSNNLNAHLAVTVRWQLRLNEGVPSPQVAQLTIPTRL